MTETHSTESAVAVRSWWKPLLLGLLCALMILFGLSLGRDTSTLPSALVGKPVPAFALPRLGGGEAVRLEADGGGTATIVNFWASWCGACRTEHEVLVELGNGAAQDGVRLIGVNYRDTAANAQKFLDERGRFPFPSGVDPDGRAGIDFGVYGLPETFFIAADGTVLARHVGALTREDAQGYLSKLGGRP
jgi:cytochrome c biogenesis protein CcmG/thiol:disulfide interchange protein DsbE